MINKYKIKYTVHLKHRELGKNNSGECQFFISVSKVVMKLGLLGNICSCDEWETCDVWMNDHNCCTCKVAPQYVSVGAAWENHGEWRCGHNVGKWGPAGPQAPPQDTPVQPTTTPATQTPHQLQQLYHTSSTLSTTKHSNLHFMSFSYHYLRHNN